MIRSGKRSRALLAAGLFALGAAAAADGGLTVGSAKQLFIDTRFIEFSEGVRLTAHAPQRTGEVVLEPDQPWESGLMLGSYHSVLGEGGKVRLWYQLNEIDHAPGQNPEFMAVAYAESADGIHFTKPVQNRVLYRGSRANGFVLPADPTLLSTGGASVARDENPAAPAAERYKSWQKIYPKKGTGIRGGHAVFVSPDGLDWKLTTEPITGLRASDTQPTWFWDPARRRYAGYSREWVVFPGERQIRMVSYNESDDLHRWEKMQMVLAPDALDMTGNPRPLLDLDRIVTKGERVRPAGAAPVRRAAGEPEPADPTADQVPEPGAPVDIYGPGITRYAEADGVYLALWSAFAHWKTSPSWPDTADVRLSVSRDGRHFHQPGGTREPFLRLGPAGSFDSKWIWPMAQPVRRGDELWFYYHGTNRAHSGELEPGAARPRAAISRATLRLDGFVSADFDYGGGTLMTPPVIFTGSRLELNLDTSAGGMGRVELLEADGSPIPGFSLRECDHLNGNSVRMPVSWQGRTDVAALAGRPVRMRIEMRSARLYAFQFR